MTEFPLATLGDTEDTDEELAVRPAGSTRPTQARIAGMVSSSERPAEAADRAVPGRWESDLIIGKGGKSQILTLVERSTRFAMLVRIPIGRQADRVAIQPAQKVRTLPEALFRSIMHDQGARWPTTPSSRSPPAFPSTRRPAFPVAAGDQREHQRAAPPVLSEGADLEFHTRAELDRVADLINRRPCQTVDWHTRPNDSAT
jgi:IS30 family transposase